MRLMLYDINQTYIVQDIDPIITYIHILHKIVSTHNHDN